MVQIDTNTADTTGASPHVLLELLCGMMKTQAIHHAARLRLAEQVEHSPKSIAELAEATGTHPPSLFRLMRALTSIDIFTELESGHFAQTPLSRFLLPDVPGSMYSVALLHGADWQWHVWEGFSTSLQTGLPAFNTLFGTDMWQYFAKEDPQAGSVFNDAMTGFAEKVNEPIATAAYDFASIDTLVDIGGGQGSLLTKILSVHPTIRHGILFDLPTELVDAEPHVAAAHLGDRCSLVKGDFFVAVPDGADAYLMKQIIKDWNDEQCVQILHNCRKAMRSGGRVLVIETVLLPGKDTSLEKFVDLQLMALLPGQERSEDQFRTIFEAAGFKLSRIVPTASPYSILEGVVA